MRRVSGRLRVAASATALVGVWFLASWLSGPRGEFALNDDWAYALAVWSLVEHGQLHLTFWQSMPLLPQIGWGWLFCAGGFSLTALRCSTLVLGAIGIGVSHALLRRFGATPGQATLGAALLAANPLYFGLAHTFMTDVPYLVLFLAAVYALVRAAEERKVGWLMLGAVVAMGATLVRQLGIAVLLAFAATSWLRFGRGRTYLLRAWLPLLLTAAALVLAERILAATGGLPRFYRMRNEQLLDALGALLRGSPGVMLHVARRTVQASFYFGLFSLPWLLAQLPGELLGLPRQRRRRVVMALGAALLLGGAALLLGPWRMPLIGNVLDRGGVGPLLIAGGEPTAPAWLWLAVTLGSWAGLVGLTWLLTQRLQFLRDLSHPAAFRTLFVLALGVLTFAPIALAFGVFFDRYILPIVPLLFVLTTPQRSDATPPVADTRGAEHDVAAAHHAATAQGSAAMAQHPAATPHHARLGYERSRWGRAARYASVALILTSLAFSVAAVHDYLAYNRATWQLAEAVRRQPGTSEQPIDAGFEYNNFQYWQPRIRQAVHGALVDRSQTPLVIATQPLDLEIAQRYPLSPWLPWGWPELFVLRRVDGSRR